MEKIKIEMALYNNNPATQFIGYEKPSFLDEEKINSIATKLREIFSDLYGIKVNLEIVKLT